MAAEITATLRIIWRWQEGTGEKCSNEDCGSLTFMKELAAFVQIDNDPPKPLGFRYCQSCGDAVPSSQ